MTSTTEPARPAGRAMSLAVAMPGGRPAAALVTGLLAAYALQALVFAGGALDAVFSSGVQNLIGVVAVTLGVVGTRRHRGGERRAWALVTLSVALSALATLLWSVVVSPDAEISIADAVFLAAYPPLYAALGIIVRERVQRFHASLWLDGAIAALGMGALAAALLWPAIEAGAHGRVLNVVVNLSYPLVDVVLLALLAGAAATLRGRMGPGPRLLGAGLTIMAAADVVYALLVAAGEDGNLPILDVVWDLALVVMALAALRRRPADADVGRLEGVRVLLLPAAFGAFALGLLTLTALDGVARVPSLLGVATLAVVMVRALLTFRENLALVDVRREARTDELTGLLNRRGVYAAIDEALADIPAGHGVALALLDLDRFKELNDTLGHQAGDELLRDLGTRLRRDLPDARLARLGATSSSR